MARAMTREAGEDGIRNLGVRGVTVRTTRRRRREDAISRRTTDGTRASTTSRRRANRTPGRGPRATTRNEAGRPAAARRRRPRRPTHGSKRGRRRGGARRSRPAPPRRLFPRVDHMHRSCGRQGRRSHRPGTRRTRRSGTRLRPRSLELGAERRLKLQIRSGVARAVPPPLEAGDSVAGGPTGAVHRHHRREGEKEGRGRLGSDKAADRETTPSQISSGGRKP